MSVLDRYLAREILPPFAAGLVFLTQVLVATQLLGQAEVLLGSGVSGLDLVVVVASLVPHFLGYVLPVAFLLGGVLGVGRLTEDRELVAMGAAGISPLRLVKVPLLLGLAVSAAALWLTLDVEPRGLKAARARVDQIVKKNVSSEVRSGVFYEDLPTLTLYAEQARAGRWRHVLIEDRSDPRAPVLALAQGGRLEPSGPGDAMRLVLEAGEVHREERGDYLEGRFAEATVSVGLGPTLGEKNRLGGSAFELTAGEIAALAHGARSPEEGRRWRSFLFRRLAGPVGILAFALLCVPIAAARRGGRAFGYGATLLAVVAYYAVMRFGEGLSQGGALPVWLGPNLANAAFVVAGGLALWGLHRKGPGAVR
ncbi:MAG TPA: LptF/LptG family permease [Anaeromyxobacteraceae bacterium]|nr:LptF/LptG family permease [Anaeromyxobacteraceae bacterium]